MHPLKLRSFLSIFLLVIAFALGCKNEPRQTISESHPSLHPAEIIFEPITEKEKNEFARHIDSFFRIRYESTGFSGAFLVAKEGEIISEYYRGYRDPGKQQAIDAETPFHLASVGKTITGTTILRLIEQGRLGLDDNIEKWFPELPYKGITVKMLLSHRSGLPNYLHFLEKNWDKRVMAGNEDVVKYMVQYKPNPEALPDQRFRYSNTNYVILALILEKVTGQSFPVYMKDSVFTPLGMTHSFVFSRADSAKYLPTYSYNGAYYYMDHTDFTYGDKNIYSTARDLLKWDRAMYENTFINRITREMAFTPQSHEVKSYHNYGLGWRIIDKDGSRVVYHNGKWHGNNTVFYRMPEKRATIIMLGNKLNSNIYKVKQIGWIFTGKKDMEEPAE